MMLAACGGPPSPPLDAAPDSPAIATPAVAVDVTELLTAANALEAAGDLAGALAKAEAALIGGGGRDAALTVAKLAILLEQYDRAASVLQPLVQADPKDAIAVYDLALVNHRRNDFNSARAGYLAALRADPSHADARFNLALLCWHKGIKEEAQHHAQKFREGFPNDPRGQQLGALMGPAAATPPPSPGP